MILFDKNPESEFIVIAEIGVNHEGDLDYAKELIRLAATTGADAVKFQSYSPERYASKENMERFERVGRFALSEEDHLSLFAQAKDSNVGCFSTPVSEDWIPFLNDHTPAFKIASGDITFAPVIRGAAATGKPLIISTGAATIEEIDQAVSWVEDEIGVEKTKENLGLMHCVSSYPAPIDQANVLSVPFLAKRYGVSVGYSNHVLEPEACLAAVALGANIIEVHFTDKKTDRDFHDHALSFEPQELKGFIESAQKIRQSLGRYTKVVQDCEVDIIPHVRKGVIAARDIVAGETLARDDLMYARPATEIAANDLGQLIGKTLTADTAQGRLIQKNTVS